MKTHSSTNKKNVLLFVGGFCLIILCVVAIFLLFSKQESPTPTYKLDSKMYGTLNYESYSTSNLPDGTTIMSSQDKNFILNGKFDNGVFKSGYIDINYNNVSYHLDGEFDNFYLKNGTLKIVTEDEEITKTGLFENNQLNGLGSLKITNRATGEDEFFFAGKFENDMPIYK